MNILIRKIYSRFSTGAMKLPFLWIYQPFLDIKIEQFGFVIFYYVYILYYETILCLYKLCDIIDH